MTRTEFMEALQRALSGTLGSSAVNGHMRYYGEYFDTQLAMGKREEEITAELGNPRLLAKTIIDAAKREGRGGGAQEYDEVYEDGTVNAEEKSAPRTFRLQGWLAAALAIILIMAVVSVVGSVVSVMLPILVPAFCIVLLVRFFQRR